MKDLVAERRRIEKERDRRRSRKAFAIDAATDSLARTLRGVESKLRKKLTSQSAKEE